MNKQLKKNYDNNVISDTVLHCAVQKCDIETYQLILECISPILLIGNGKNEAACDIAINSPIIEGLRMALRRQHHVFCSRNRLQTSQDWKRKYTDA